MATKRKFVSAPPGPDGGAVQVVMIVLGGDGGGMQRSSSVQRLVDTMLDQAVKDWRGVEFMIWLPSLEGLVLPRDSDRGGDRDVAVCRRMRHCYRGRRIQAFDNAGALITWVSPAGGIPVPPHAPTYVGDLVAEQFTTY